MPVVVILESKFSNLQGLSSLGGGALLIRDDSVDKSDLSIFNRTLFNCTFSGSHSYSDGGAISLVNTAGVYIMSSSFTGNQAEGKGGAIMFSCSDY